MIGASLRYLIDLAFLHLPHTFPFATLMINLSGTFFLSWLLVRTDRFSPSMQTVIGTGMIGAYTTFSTLSVEVFTLIESQKTLLAYLYLLFTIGGGWGMAWLGYRMGRRGKEKKTK